MRLSIPTWALYAALSLSFSSTDGFVLNLETRTNAISSSRLASSTLRHDYQRDDSQDNSSVDLVTVNKMLGERLQARKQGDYDTADWIRNQLERDHKVRVFDQDRVWATVSEDNDRTFSNRGGRRQFAQGGRGDRGGRGVVGGRGDRRRGGGRGSRPNRDFRNDFGPTGHDYSPFGQAGPIASELSEAEIHGKISERLMAKMNRDFDKADQVQLELAQKGVYVNDRTKEWRGDGVEFVDPSAGRRQPSDRNRPYVQSRYSQPLPSSASHEEIERLVAERDQCKRTKKYQRADTIRDSLLEDFDVVVDDRVREWSVGGSFGKDADTKRALSEAMKNRDYVQSSASLDLPEGVSIEEVQALVDKRTEVKRNKQYQVSDALRDELLEKYGVSLHDGIKMWSVGGEFGTDDPLKARAIAKRTFTRRGGGNLSPEDLAHIEDQLAQRAEAKKNRDFKEADFIRGHLYEAYKINIDDATREWRVLSDDYVQVEPEAGAKTELTPEEIEHVESRIQERTRHKKGKSFALADAICDELRDYYSVTVNDKKKEWRIAANAGRSRPKAAQGERPRQPRGEEVYDDSPGGVAGATKLDDVLGWLEDEGVLSQEDTPATTGVSDSLSSVAAGSNDGDESLKEVTQSAALLDDEPIMTENHDDLDSNDELDPIDSLSSASDLSDSVTYLAEEESVPPSSELSEDELMAMTIPLLKEKLREAGKPVSGNKAELIERLLS